MTCIGILSYTSVDNINCRITMNYWDEHRALRIVDGVLTLGTSTERSADVCGWRRIPNLRSGYGERLLAYKVWCDRRIVRSAIGRTFLALDDGFIGGGSFYFNSTIGQPSLSHFNSVTISFEIPSGIE